MPQFYRWSVSALTAAEGIAQSAEHTSWQRDRQESDSTILQSDNTSRMTQIKRIPDQGVSAAPFFRRASDGHSWAWSQKNPGQRPGKHSQAEQNLSRKQRGSPQVDQDAEQSSAVSRKSRLHLQCQIFSFVALGNKPATRAKQRIRLALR